MDIKQDPNAIPNFNAGGRVGEPQRNEPEQAQSSVELDATAGGDGAASSAAPADGHEPPPGGGKGPAVTGRDARRAGRGAIDGLVGAP